MSADTAELIAQARRADNPLLAAPGTRVVLRALAAALEAAEARADGWQERGLAMQDRAEAVEAREKALEGELRKAREGWDGWQAQALAAEAQRDALAAEPEEPAVTADTTKLIEEWAWVSKTDYRFGVVRAGDALAAALEAAVRQRDALALELRVLANLSNPVVVARALAALAAVEPPEEQS